MVGFDVTPIFVVLVTFFNLCWIGTYILVIRRGFKDGAFGMPFVGVLANLSFDTIFSFVYPAPVPQLYLNILYIGFGLGMLYQALQFGQQDFPYLSKGALYFTAVLAFSLCVGLFIAITNQFDNEANGMYAGYVNVLITSSLFVGMVSRRPDVRGQSLYIALAKLLGTAALSLGLYLYPLPGLDASPLMTYLYVAVFVIDVTYLVMVYQKCVAQGINPWRRL